MFFFVSVMAIGVFASDGAVEDASVEGQLGMEIDCVGAILMDAKTGTVFYEKNADEALLRRFSFAC